MSKQYRIEAPLGNMFVPNKILSEKELREFVIQIISDTDQIEVWKEKSEKDDIKSVVDWLITAGYKVKEINE